MNLHNLSQRLDPENIQKISFSPQSFSVVFELSVTEKLIFINGVGYLGGESVLAG
jgi:hypothetical protein